jgi:hypothetical protein
MSEEPEPSTAAAGELVAPYLGFYREKAIEKVAALTEEEQRSSRLASGWTPLELLHHLACMEERWFVWGFLGEDVAEPWRDSDGDRWVLPREATAEHLAEQMRATGRRTSAVLAGNPLETVAAVGGRFADAPPSLAWISFHVLQEYARHVGHLDIAVELAGGPLGE